jgi:hypothetical protein
MSYPTEGRKKKKQAKNEKKKEARKYKKGPGNKKDPPLSFAPNPSHPQLSIHKTEEPYRLCA